MAPDRPLVLCMVGLPARGKSYIARKIVQYLQWMGVQATVFNVGSYRRERLGSGQSADFFDPGNPSGASARGDMAEAALRDLLSWLGPGRVAVYDATNVGRGRRDRLRARCADAAADVVFIESVCNDQELVDANIRQTKLRSPDYAGVAESEAIADFRARIAHYERAWEPVDAADGSFVRLTDVGRRVEVHEVSGWLPSRLVFLLMNLHVTPRSIWLTRHGESEWNAAGRIGGDSGLTASGFAYGDRLARWLPEAVDCSPELWTSTLLRTRQTAAALPAHWPRRALRSLDEIDAGACDGMTYEEIETHMPHVATGRSADKLRFRYPSGESYEDVIARLEPAIVDLERMRGPVVVVAHQAVLRALYAYFTGRPAAETPHLSVPLHTVIRLTPSAYGCDELRTAPGDD